MKRSTLFFLTCFLVACSDAPDSVELLSFDDLPGGFAVGVRTDVQLYDISRNRDVTATFWYPANGENAGPEQAVEGVELRSGSERYPLLVLVHGIFGNAPGTWQYLAPHLASYGYIIAAPSTGSNLATLDDLDNHPGDISFLIDVVLAESAVDPMFAGRAESSSIAAGGFSLGAVAAYRFAYNPMFADPRVSAVILMAGGDVSPAPINERLSLLALFGTSDIIVPYELGLNIYEAANPSKYLITLEGGGHVGFTSSDDSGIGATMPEARHEALTRQSVLAFLTSVFATASEQRAAARGFLQNSFSQNNGDVEILYQVE